MVGGLVWFRGRRKLGPYVGGINAAPTGYGWVL